MFLINYFIQMFTEIEKTMHENVDRHLKFEPPFPFNLKKIYEK